MFGKPLPQLTFNDVVAFLNQGLRENVYLDYKRELPNAAGIARLACAYANTMGGFMVFGADEHNEVPVPPFEGGNLGNNPNQTIHAACYQAVVPPITPVYSPLLANPGDPNKAFLVVAIPQSGNAPHAMANDGRVYVKVSDHKEPVQPSLDLYNALLANRQLSVERANAVIGDVQNRMTDVWQRAIVPTTTQTTLERHIEIEVTIRRAYPMGGDLSTPQQLVAEYMGYHVLLVDPFLDQIIFPADTEHFLQTFPRGVNSVPAGAQRDDGLCTIIHRDGAVCTRAFLSGFEQDVTLRTGAASVAYILSAESVCAFTFAAIRCGLRLLRHFGAYCAVDVTVAISEHNLPEVFTNNPMDRTLRAGMPQRMLLGPATLHLHTEHRLAWPSADELEQVERAFATAFVSAFNVSDANYVEMIIRESRRRVRTPL